MAEAQLGIVARASDQASQDLREISKLLGEIAGKSAQAQGGLGRIAQTAAGFMTGMVGFQALGAIGGMIRGTVDGMIGLNAETEGVSKSFEILLSDAAAATDQVSEGMNEASQATASAGSAIRDAQERMADAAEDHALSLGKIGREMERAQADATAALAELGADFVATMADMEAAHAKAMGRIDSQFSELDRNFQRSMQSRVTSFREAMSDLEASHGKTMTNLRSQLRDYQAAFEQQSTERKQRFQEESGKAADRFLREREAHARTADEIQAAITEEETKGTGADRALLASLRQRLAEEQRGQQMTYTEYLKQLAARQKAEEEAAQAAQQKQIAAVQQRMADENAEYEQRKGRMQAAYDNDVMQLQATLAEQKAAVEARRVEEEVAFAESMATRKAKYDEDVANAREAETEKLAALRERITEEERSYARSLRDLQQALEGAQASYAKTESKVKQTTATSVNQMAQMYANLAKEAGRPLETAKDRAAAMLDWIKKKAKETPFDMPQVREAAQRLMAYQLDATEFLDTVGNVASGMNVPVKQVADAFGALATGQMGEAVMRFREFGVNLKSIGGLKFDAQGALVTPVNEALNSIKAAMDERFGGMMAEQATTFTGITSNLRDAWGQFLEVMGKPIFVEVREALKTVLAYVDSSQTKLQEFGKTLGAGLGSAIKQVVPILDSLMTGFFDWVASGQAKQDIEAVIPQVLEFTGAMGKVAKAIVDVTMWLVQNREAMKSLFGAMQTVLGFMVGPYIRGIDSVRDTWRVLHDDVIPWLGNIDDEVVRMAMVVDAELAEIRRSIETFVGNVATKLTEWSAVLGDIFEVGLITMIRNAWTGENGFEGIIKGAINNAIEFVNSFIRHWNDLKMTFGRVEVAGQIVSEGFTLQVPQLPEIPRLAKGGIVSRPTLAVLGDGGSEAVVPLGQANGLGRPINIYVTGNTILGDDRSTALELARILRPHLDGLVELGV